MVLAAAWSNEDVEEGKMTSQMMSVACQAGWGASRPVVLGRVAVEDQAGEHPENRGCPRKWRTKPTLEGRR